MERVIALATELFDRFEAFGHLTRHFSRVVDDDLIALLRSLTQRCADKLMQLLQVRFGFFGTGQNHWEGHVNVVRVHQDPEQIQKLFSGASTAREDDDAVTDTHKRFETLFNVWQYHQLINDRVWGLGGNNARLG